MTRDGSYIDTSVESRQSLGSNSIVMHSEYYVKLIVIMQTLLQDGRSHKFDKLYNFARSISKQTSMRVGYNQRPKVADLQ